MTSVEIASSWSQIGLVVVSASAILLGLIVYVRILGLRSFSKMSSFDFAVTVAMGSLLASVAMSGSSLAEGLVAIGTLLGVQFVLALGRSRWHPLASVVDNKPLLLMAGPEVLHENLRRARITPADLHYKLREAGLLNYDDVRYVVLETTGDVSVAQGDGDLDPDILADVVDAGDHFD